jgi:hypothetical protein
VNSGPSQVTAALADVGYRAGDMRNMAFTARRDGGSSTRIVVATA